MRHSNSANCRTTTATKHQFRIVITVHNYYNKWSMNLDERPHRMSYAVIED